MVRPSRALALALAAFFTLPAVLAGEPAEPAAVVCPEGMRTMEGVGLVCPRPDGLYEVFSAAYESLGFIHGTDPIPPESAAADEPIEVAAGTTVNCVSGSAGTYYIQVIYARASNDADGYAANLNKIRWITGQANKLLDDATIATGMTSSLNVKCVSGQVEVKNEVLPTALSFSTFGTIVTDLRNKGYNDGKVKYWVYFDDTSACSCGGTGHLYNDDSLSASNLNNGNGVSMFAVNFGYNSTRIWMHELGHNMGAVQNSAPRSTGAGHCIDGLDTMCYNDGGPNGGSYSPSVCSTEVFDCGKNDYCHASPAGGSYLATKWNVCGSLNRFILRGVSAAPVLTTLSCSPNPAEVGSLVTCSFLATDDSSGVRYTINWGDGTTTYYPSSTTYTAPGVMRSSQHTYSTTGTKTVSVSVVDEGGLPGNTLTRAVSVVADMTPPVLTVQDPAPASLYVGCTSKVANPVGTVWLDRGCIRATATDAKSGVDRVEVYVAGVFRGMDTTAPYQIEVAAPHTATSVSVRVEAVDGVGNRASQTFFVSMVDV